MAAFSSPIQAIKWCHLVQEALPVASWPDRLLSYEGCEKVTTADGRLLFRGPRVKMGLNIGNPELKQNPITGTTSNDAITDQQLLLLSQSVALA